MTLKVIRSNRNIRKKDLKMMVMILIKFKKIPTGLKKTERKTKMRRRKTATKIKMSKKVKRLK